MNQRKRDNILQKGMFRTGGSILGPLAYGAVTLFYPDNIGMSKGERPSIKKATEEGIHLKVFRKTRATGDRNKEQRTLSSPEFV